MPTVNFLPKRLPNLRSLYVRSILVVMLCVGAVVVTAELLSLRMLRDTINQNVTARAVEVTRLTAQQVAGAYRFGDIDAITLKARQALASAKGDAVGALALSGEGDVLVELLEDGADAAALREIALAAVKRGAGVASDDGLIRAEPVTAQ